MFSSVYVVVVVGSVQDILKLPESGVLESEPKAVGVKVKIVADVVTGFATRSVKLGPEILLSSETKYTYFTVLARSVVSSLLTS